MANCTFCKIVAGELPGSIVFRDDLVTAFRDIHPVTPTHILIVPNRHIDSVNVLAESDGPLIGHIYMVAKQIAAQEGIADGGYRLVTNTNAHAGQTVFHVHVHLLGGAPMKFGMA
jgi:histidine triad (HIT) family protein